MESRATFRRRHFGFAKRRSTIHGVGEAVLAAKKSNDAKRFCAVMTLDIKKAFNAVDGIIIIKSLNEQKPSAHLIKIVDIYFYNGSVLYNTTDGIREYRISAGVPQGSILAS